MLPDPNPSLLCHKHTCKAVFNRAVWEVPYCQSVHHTSFQNLPSTLDPGSMGCKGSQAHSKQCVSITVCRGTAGPLPTIFGQDPLRLNLMKQNFNWVAWPFTCYTPVPSPRNQVPATQPLRPLFPLSVPHGASTEAVDRSDLPGASLPGGTEKIDV